MSNVLRTNHWITVTDNGRVEKEEVTRLFLTEWRGVVVTVRISADRYRHSSGISEWRIYADQARKGTEGYGEHLTDTARRRLSEKFSPLVQEWLNSNDSGDGSYTQSRRRVFTAVIKGKLSDLGRIGPDQFRRLLDNTSTEIPVPARDHFARCVDAFVAFKKLAEMEV